MMADVRALLAAERQSRRVSHPHLSYTKSGMLMCSVCNLNVKSEALWEGHLRSANHKKNVTQSTQESTSKGVKRKIQDVDEVDLERYEAETDARKKPKPRPESIAEIKNDGLEGRIEPQQEEAEANDQVATPAPSAHSGPRVEEFPDAPLTIGSTQGPIVDEDEWAAFERDVAPLTAVQLDYASATISAAPVSAEQLTEQADEDKRRRVETEAEDEKEEEERRLEEEFEIMEEMEERVRRLREKRDALRGAPKPGGHAGKGEFLAATENTAQVTAQEVADERDDNDEDEDEDEDDWYS